MKHEVSVAGSPSIFRQKRT